MTDTSSETENEAPPPARHAKAPKPKSGGSFLRELPILVAVALLLALLIKTFLVQAFYIPSASMENTLQGGVAPNGVSVATAAHPFDRVLVNKLVYRFRSPHRGEIVVFRQPPGWPNENAFTTSSNPVARFVHNVGSAIGIAPSGGSDFIKRVIGVAGDHVVCCNAKHQITVNGKALDEPYIDLEGASPADAYRPFNITVPKGDLWVMGDHRNDSDDSRVNGPVPTSYVVGRAFLVIWPIKDWKHLPVPTTFDQSGLKAAGLTAVPYAAGGVAVLPLAWWRRRRHHRRPSYARTDG